MVRANLCFRLNFFEKTPRSVPAIIIFLIINGCYVFNIIQQVLIRGVKL